MVKDTEKALCHFVTFMKGSPVESKNIFKHLKLSLQDSTFFNKKEKRNGSQNISLFSTTV